MILQTVWNECVRFGGHINIQDSLYLTVGSIKEGPNLAQCALHSTRADLRQFWKEDQTFEAQSI
jgi:hypothetical protein